ncbi:MAG TPA: GNAT family N-acetyltransferase, partial [Solirubrobacteraceae bacterium]|nr:GNAT family N-acetyltransferase [Solirubrobacteraceae bacterium]
RVVNIRPIEASDASALHQAYERLSDDTKYKRFMATKPHLSRRDISYLTHIDGDNHVALVATPVGEPDQIIGVARYVRLPEDARTAEFAIVIGDRYQGDGLGSALMSRLADAATAHGVKRLRGTMLADNIAAHKLTRRLAGELAHERNFGTVDELQVELSPARTPA